MAGDGGVADGLSQGERWDTNYKRQEESCWLAHRNLSKQLWEEQASMDSGEGGTRGNVNFCPQAPSASARAQPPLQGDMGSPFTLCHTCNSLITMVLDALSLALLSPALHCPKGILVTMLLVPDTSQQV